MPATVEIACTDHTPPNYTYTLHVTNGSARGAVVVSVPIAIWVIITSISDDGEDLGSGTADRRVEWNLLMEAEAETDLTIVVRGESMA